MNTPPGSYAAPQGEIPEDTPVFDVNAEKVGTVVVSALRDGYFVVEKGLIFTHELYLPATAIQARDANGVSLRLSKDELKDDRWKQPPSGYVEGAAAQPFVSPNAPPGVGPTPNEPMNMPPPDEEPPLVNR
jgi:hypothetical protein